MEEMEFHYFHYTTKLRYKKDLEKLIFDTLSNYKIFWHIFLRLLELLMLA